MRRRPLRSAPLLFCLLWCTACGSGTGGAAVPTATPTTGPVDLGPLPSAGSVSATIPSVGGAISPTRIYGIYAIAADDTAVWVHNADQGTVLRVDPTTNKVAATIHVGRGLGDVVLEAGFVWVSNHDDNTVSKIDPRTNKVVDIIAVPPPTGNLGVSPGAVWVIGEEGGAVSEIDAQTDRVAATTFSTSLHAWTAYTAGSLWVCNGTDFGVTRVDPMSGTVLAAIVLAPGRFYSCDGIAASDDGVWVGLMSNLTTHLGLVRIDPATNKVATSILLPQTDAIVALAADTQGVWSARPNEGLVRISPQTHRAVGFLPLRAIAGVAVGAGSVWALDEDGTLQRITPAS